MKCEKPISAMLKIKTTTVLRVIVFLILFVLFCIFYFTPIIDQYWKELTNTAKHDDKGVIELPAITMCFKPKFKPSVFENYNITEDIFFQEKFPNLTAKKNVKVQNLKEYLKPFDISPSRLSRDS